MGDAGPVQTFKILLIGDSGTGKSSLLLRFVDDRFEDEGDQFPTIGVDFKTKLLTPEGGAPVRLSLWDTAGQERFRSLTSSYYRGSVGVCLVYDVTRRETFDNMEAWFKELAMYTPAAGLIKMVVGNKLDQRGRPGLGPGVTREEGLALAQRRGCLFIEASAKTSVGVAQAFEEMVQKILESPDLLARGDDSGPGVAVGGLGEGSEDEEGGAVGGGCCM